MIGRSGQRGSGISMLAARHNDDDDETSMVTRTALCKINEPTVVLFII